MKGAKKHHTVMSSKFESTNYSAIPTFHPKLLYPNKIYTLYGKITIYGPFFYTQICCVQAKMYRLYKKMTMFIFLYNLYIFVWIYKHIDYTENDNIFLTPSYRELSWIFYKPCKL